MSKTILIVEDNELNMKLFSDLLEANGYATVQTRSGVEAVGLARENGAEIEGEPSDMHLLDPVAEAVGDHLHNTRVR